MKVTNTTARAHEARLPVGHKIFTYEHATRTLPLVKHIVADIVEQYKRICALEERCQVAPPPDSAVDIQALRDQYADELDRLRDLRDELSVIGCQLKEWRRGVVDFTVQHNGRLVELCWRLGDERLEHWHEFNCGFRQRQPIDDDFIASLAADATH